MGDVTFDTTRTARATLRCVRAALALAAIGPLAAIWIILPDRAALRRRIAAAAWAIVLRGFAVRLRVHGAPADPGDALIVANHISWLDIVALGRLVDGGFVAKAEVGRWPLIGGLAQRYGCLFVDRERRIAAHGTVSRMDAYPERRGLVLFPEGTTGDGSALLPFRSSLFAGSRRWPCVQPVAISYRERDGSPLSPQRRRGVAWLGEDALLPHAMALAAAGGVLVDLWFEPPVAPANRKEAAESSHRAIAGRLALIAAKDQAAALKRAA